MNLLCAKHYAKDRAYNATDWLFVSPQNTMLMPWSLMWWHWEMGAFGRQLGHEGEALINEINILLVNTRRDYLSFLTIQGRKKKMAIYKREGGPSPEPSHDGTLISDFPASITVRNICYCLSCPVYAILLQQPKLRQKTRQKNKQKKNPHGRHIHYFGCHPLICQ